MTKDRLIGLGLAFSLGACASTAITTDLVPSAQAAASATVRALADAPRAIAPSGKAQVQHLARGDNAYIGRLSLEPGAAVPEHQDATEEYIHILEGRGTIEIDGAHFEVEPGTTIYMPAKARVRFTNGETKLVGLQVFAGPSPAAKYDTWTALEEAR